MKEIKIRCFNHRTKLMFDVESLGIGKSDYQNIARNYKVDMLGYNSFYQKNATIMLGLNLVDTNDKNCYENDIVELDNGKAIIKFDGIRFYFEVLDEDDWCCDWEIEDLHRMKVIGNIYQNKELLDKER